MRSLYLLKAANQLLEGTGLQAVPQEAGKAMVFLQAYEYQGKFSDNAKFSHLAIYIFKLHL